jgi:predicted MFS family arabinose efflux permease
LHERASADFRIAPLVPIFATYTLFGAGYIAYMTFIVAFLRTRGLDESQLAIFWAILGAAAIPAAFIWGPILSRLREGRGVAAVMLVVLAGAVLPLVASGPFAAFGSAALFGGSFLAVVTAVTEVGRRATPVESWTRVIGALTVALALGQCVGPILAGVLSDGTSGLRAGMLLSALLLAGGALVALRQRDTDRQA